MTALILAGSSLALLAFGYVTYRLFRGIEWTDL